MLKRITFKQAEYTLAAFAALAGFIVYFQTLCPTVNFIDSGELSTVCYTLSIAHPTGYPLFTLLGYLFSHLPLGLRTIYQLNLLAAIYCSIGLFFFFRLLVFILQIVSTKNKYQSNEKFELNERAFVSIFVPAFAGTVALGFSETFWSQALSIEVYSLHIVFLPLVLFVFLKAIQSEYESHVGKIIKSDSRYWYLFAFVLGLSFTNHLSTIFLAPALLIAYFAISGFGKISWKRLLLMGVPFVVGLSAYLYLPIRAMNEPILNWGNPVDAQKLFWHLSGKVYRVWFLQSSESVIKQFKLFFETLPAEFAYAGTALAVVGLFKLFKESRKGVVFTLLLFFGCVIFASFYDIHDIETYFLLAYLTIGIWIAFGVKFFIELKENVIYKWIIVLAILVFVVFVCFMNYEKVDESKMTLVEEYSKDMLNSIDNNGILISFQWDYFVSAVYYLQLVENFRSDVVIIDKELLRRTWYYPQLRNRYPWLIDQSKNELEDFLKELYKFEHEIPYDPRIIEFRYTTLIHSLVEKNWNSRSVFVTPEIEQQYINVYQKVPSGLAFRLHPNTDTLIHQIAKKEFTFSIPTRADKYSLGLLSFYSQSYMNYGSYLQYHQQINEAEQYLNKARELQSHIPQGK